MAKRIVAEIVLIVVLFSFVQECPKNSFPIAVIIIGGAINIALRFFGFFNVDNK